MNEDRRLAPLSDAWLKREFQAAPVPDDLQTRLMNELERQAHRHSTPRASRRRRVMAAIVLLALAPLLLWSVVNWSSRAACPPLLSAAVAHVERERRLYRLPDKNMEHWLNTHGWNGLTRDLPVEFAKVCRLAAWRSQHIRFQDPQAGKVNLFFLPVPERDLHLRGLHGEVSGMYWRTETLGPHLTLLVLSEGKLEEKVVKQLLHILESTPPKKAADLDT